MKVNFYFKNMNIHRVIEDSNKSILKELMIG